MSTAALATPKPALPPPFQAPDHAPFFWANGDDAILLVHGFPGTPAEMRPLAKHLHAQGWTTQGLLLPGFGENMPSIGDYSLEDWQNAVDIATADLTAGHCSVSIVGNSIGSMLALRTALRVPVKALVLIAPFWRIEDRLLDLAFPLLKPFVGHMRPFRKADFADADFRASIRAVLGDSLDLDDRQVQAAIRDLPLPTSALANVRGLGHRGHAAATHVQVPVCIVHSTDDPVAASPLAQQFAQRLVNLQGYIAIPGGHDTVRIHMTPDAPVSQLINRFLCHNVRRPLDQPNGAIPT